MKRRVITLSIMSTGLAVLGMSLIEREPKFLYNPSPSAPIGWYKIVPQESYQVGETVAAWLPAHAEKLASERGYLPDDITIIKSIIAGPGDQYCVETGRLLIAGHQPLDIFSSDSQGRDMPVMSEGCRRLSGQEYLLISERIKQSFDSRYFGPVAQSDILGRADFIDLSNEVLSSEHRGTGGARGRGAQGKIKDRGTNTSLSHCLHIDFYSTVWPGIVPTQRQTCNGDRRLGWYYFTINHERSSGPG